MFGPARAVTEMVFGEVRASGGNTTVKPAEGIAMVPPRMPMVFVTVIGADSAMSRCTGFTVIADDSREFDGAVGVTDRDGAAGLSLEQPAMATEMPRATASERRRGARMRGGLKRMSLRSISARS